MTDPLALSVPLGRFFGVRVRIHWILLLFLAGQLFSAATSTAPSPTGRPLLATSAWLLLLLLALALHEVGHALMARRLGHEPEDVWLGPLGNLLGHWHPPRTVPAVALAGPALNLALALGCAGWLSAVVGASMAFSPFGDPVFSGAPLVKVAGKMVTVTPFGVAWFVGWFGHLNWVIFLANIIPALPFDGGRALRSWPTNPAYGTSRDTLIAPWVAHVSAIVLALTGIFRLFRGGFDECLTLIGLALMIEFFVRAEARSLDEGGFFDDSVFGYDFSEGYTSLEAGAAKVQPRRDSVIRRWRRNRSELRRRRLEARTAARERRMDEILEKLHLHGRSALTGEEQRFLVRVSRQYRNRPKSK